ncbi:MAG: division/cell wall cluster transcriptional repressor MraZ [Gammaproteobacteria bacterium]|uniref:Transcriptional regulator MraZ n=1 Tax=Marinomonas polaris DSM 16579 TaxID=1122206 RepID=A0A1M5G9Z0_9GAMM|nr:MULTISPECIES: division/cell wall cluster transcriptional repressor MraZ [Marinomonas]MBU1294868.1 division/cell wall cluster transcriptional repressor MraZ [Gammaproteobacteria bacterium]MBU2022701.1 division/cell wall cluster transcriptional repressor MraZ [Gammaproteobacteria bacterium]MBU2237561.1 division/cell wall cluster transcriptional repressor MraZ [Gammaproteobacteria bacterium]MBU2318499.1 division/cell wall cluster transcriptional repressor MraZ [Gammaproteobacteria bacterium]MB
MFRGIHQVSVDVKGRMSLPARLRDDLAQYDDDGVVVTIDPVSRCLLLYPLSEWELIQQKLDKLPTFQPQARRLQRLLVGHATDLEVDKAGRILLPAPLREFARLDKKLTILGQGKKLEIWSQEEWEAQREDYLSQDALADLQTETMMDISL